jgi:DNA-binding transcriptional MerR regulator
MALDQRFYSVSRFSRQASVSVRTVRYYDKVGLLPPSHFSPSGYRLYSEKDMVRLRYILTLKSLGFSLREIKTCLQATPQGLKDVLGRQKAMMIEKRSQIDAIILAIEAAEKQPESGQGGLDPTMRAIQVVMELKPYWVNKYLTPEQRLYMRELSRKSYSRDALDKLADRGWTEDNHKLFQQRYELFRLELARLAAEGADPAGPGAQALAGLLREIIDGYSQGDPQILAGMRKSWDNFCRIPDERKPPAYSIGEEERNFLKRAMAVMYKDKRPTRDQVK